MCKFEWGEIKFEWGEIKFDLHVKMGGKLKVELKLHQPHTCESGNKTKSCLVPYSCRELGKICIEGASLKISYRGMHV